MTCLCQVKARFRLVPDDYCTSGFTSHYCCNLKSKATGYVRQEASHLSRHVSLCCRDDKKTLGLYGDYVVFAELHRVHDGFGPARVLIAFASSGCGADVGYWDYTVKCIHVAHVRDASLVQSRNGGPTKGLAYPRSKKTW